MKITKEGNTLNFEFKNGSIIALWEEWSQFIQLKKYNWCTINFITATFESDRQCGHYEIQFVLLGLGLRILIPNETKKSTEFMNMLDKQVSDIKHWKTIYIHKNQINYTVPCIYTKRPKKFKNFKKCYLQIN